jgi:hypothetical protein
MSFFFALVFIVLVFWRPQEWLVPQLYGLPLLDGVVYASLLGLLMETKMGRIRFPRQMPQAWLLIGLFLAAILSHVPHTYFDGIVATAPEMFKITFFALLLACVVDTEKRFRAVAAVFVVMACFMAIHALLQESRGYGFANQQPLWIPAIKNRPAHTRSLFFGIFSDPNDLAQVLTVSIPLAFLIFRNRILSLGVGTLVAVLLVQGVLATHSRGGLVAMAGTGAVMLSMMLPTRWFPFLMISMLLGALAMCPLSAGYLDMSAHERVIFWGMANEQFKHNILFGIGQGMFWQVASSMAAHNAFVHCYTEIGFVGYWFWFGLLGLGILGLWRTRRAMLWATDTDGRWLKFAAGMTLAAITGFSASAYFLSRAFVFPLFFLFAMMAVLPRLATERLAEEAEEDRQGDGADLQESTGEEQVQLLGSGKDIWLFNSVAAVISIVYIYFSIVLLNKAFYG